MTDTPTRDHHPGSAQRCTPIEKALDSWSQTARYCVMRLMPAASAALVTLGLGHMGQEFAHTPRTAIHGPPPITPGDDPRIRAARGDLQARTERIMLTAPDSDFWVRRDIRSLLTLAMLYTRVQAARFPHTPDQLWRNWFRPRRVMQVGRPATGHSDGPSGRPQRNLAHAGCTSPAIWRSVTLASWPAVQRQTGSCVAHRGTRSRVPGGSS